MDSLVQLQSEVAKMEDVFRGLSKIFQHMVNHDISSEEVEEMMYNMKKEKEKLVIIRTIIPTKLNLHHNLAAQLVSVNETRKEMYAWCNKANAFIELCSFPIKGNLSYFNEQLTKHKTISASLIKMTSQYQSVKKVCDTILNNLKCNEGIDTMPLRNSLIDLNNTFENTTSKLENTEVNIQEGIMSWDNYNSSKHFIEMKLSEVKKMAQLSTIKSNYVMEGSQTFIEIENQLKLHQSHYMDLQRFLNQDDKDAVYRDFNQLENEWHNILQTKDISNIKSTFDQANR